MTGDMKQDKTAMASQDGRTEIVLATTFLVLVVLLFIRFERSFIPGLSTGGFMGHDTKTSS